MARQVLSGRGKRGRRRDVALGAALLLGIGFASFAAWSGASAGPRPALPARDPDALSSFPDPARIVGVGSCAECHEQEVEVWKQSAHYAAARSLPRKPAAKRIARALGIRRIKAADACISCHYTVEQSPGGRLEATGGVSCESCHGAADGWLEIHDKYGGRDATRETETPAHREERLARSDRAGMNRAEPLYRLAESCFACHTTPGEELVDVGGHPVGSDFELMSWSQGEMRHNYWRGPAGANVESSPERKRLLYLVGQTLELASALRGLARVRADGPYARRVEERVRAAVERLTSILALTPLPEVRDALRVAEGGIPAPDQRDALRDAAATARRSAETIARSYSGSELAALDARVEALQRLRETRP